MALESGTQLCHYGIVEQIGKGGMGEVYRARDKKLGRDVAIKVLPSEFAEDSERLLRFEREARLLASLNHPNIAAIYGLEEHEGKRFLVLELVEGDTLADRMSSEPIPEDEALKIALQIAEAVEAAHEKGVIHRDLKPANVKITPEGKVKVLDFGLAKSFVGDDIDVSLSNSPTMSIHGTGQGVILGTAAYMSPEQVRGRPLDKRTDVWSFGVVLYEMLTGRRLFSGETISDIVAGVLRAEPDWDAVPIRFRRLLSRCLERDADKRLRHLGDVGLWLDDSADSVARVPETVLRRTWPMPALVAVMVVLVGALIVVGLRSPSTLMSRFSHTEMLLPQGVRDITAFSISPDGRKLAFRGVSDEGADIWVRDIGEGESRRLEGTFLANVARLHGTPIWSPDSASLAYWSDGALRRIDVRGGPPRRIADIPGPPNSGFWTAGDVLVFDYPGSEGLWQVPAAGTGPPVPVTRGQNHTLASPLPDGRRFLFTESVDGVGTVYAGSIDLAPEQQTLVEVVRDVDGAVYVEAPDQTGFLLILAEGILTAQPFDPEALALVAEPQTLAANIRRGGYPSAGGILVLSGFSASPGALVLVTDRSEGNELAWFDSNGIQLGTVGEADSWGSVDLSWNGDRLAASNLGDLFIHELDGPTRSRALALDANSDTFPAWSPDGRQIAYSRFAGPDTAFDLYRRSADGTGEAEVLLARPGADYAGSWSGDGRYLVFWSTQTANADGDIWVLPVADDGDPFPLVVSPDTEAMPSVSPDDKWLSYATSRSGYFEVWIRAFDPTPGAETSAQLVGNGWVSHWSADSRELFYLTEPDRVLMVVDVTEGPDGNPSIGQPRELFATGATDLFFDVTPDGERFIFPVPKSSERDAFSVIQGWPSLFDE